MSRYRYALIPIAAVAVLAGASIPAYADEQPVPKPNPKPTCNLVVDPNGDTQPSSPQLDILSGDVATGAANVVAVARLAAVGGSDPVTVAGARWDFSFTVGSARYVFSAQRAATGAVSTSLTRNTAGSSVVVAYPSVVFDVPGSKITWTVPRSAVTDLPAIPAGDLITSLSVATFAGPAGNYQLDSAKSAARYPDGNPSCVKAS